jgi:hypothetical protein
MCSRFLSRRGLFVLSWLLVLLALGALLGCSAERASSPLASEALRDRFPEQVKEVLEAGPGFVATGEGFASRPRAATPGGFHPAGEPIEAVLSTRGEEGLRFRGQRGFALTVREIGAAGDAVGEGSAVTYGRAGGRSYWSAMANGGAEEWLLLEAESVTSEAPVAVWEVEGASLRQQGESVEVVDEGGKARMRVTAPRAYAEGGRAVKARVVASGGRIALWVEASGEAVLVDPVWQAAGPMNDARFGHTATLLPSGQVLVVGGHGSGDFLASAELYDPATNSWLPAGVLSTFRIGHTATLLSSGQVLVAGGGGNGNQLPSAELYNPATNSWLPTGALSTVRSGHTATLLSSGQVLVTGGSYNISGSSEALASAELYNPTTNSWFPASALSTARVRHTATLLSSGQVLVAGGNESYGNHLASAELYDPATDSWLSAGAMSIGRIDHTATLLLNGQVLVAGGSGSYNLSFASAELYDPATHSWLPTGPMSEGRHAHTATLLPSGHVLVTGCYVYKSSPRCLVFFVDEPAPILS